MGITTLSEAVCKIYDFGPDVHDDGGLFDLLQPTLAAHIVDNGIVSRSFSVIEQTGFLMLGVALMSLITGVLCNFLQAGPRRILALTSVKRYSRRYRPFRLKMSIPLSPAH